MAAKPLPSQELLLQLLDYNAESGALTWRQRENIHANWNPRWAGQPAFTKIISRGYFSGQIAKSDCLAHRIIWKMVHGFDPETIDHINGNKLDNRICNLRSISQQENARNRPINKKNKSGHPCIKKSGEAGLWRVCVAGKHIGAFLQINEAIAARDRAWIELGFHHNHGRRE